MTDLAYAIMLLAADDSGKVDHSRLIALRPGNVSATDWENFLHDIAKALDSLRSLEDGLGEAKQATCSAKDVISPSNKNWAKKVKLGSVPFPVALDYKTGNDCGVLYHYCPQGIYVPATKMCVQGLYVEHVVPHTIQFDHSGEVLGFWAADIDDHEEDTHLTIKPANIAGIGKVAKTVGDLAAEGASIPLIPVFCLVKCIIGECDSCLNDAKNFADSANPSDEILGALPNVGNIYGLSYVGVWHFVGLQATANNSFDDHSGYQMENGGPTGNPDALVTVMMAGIDVSGLTLNYDKSKGPKQYQIASGHDFHPDTVMRDKGAWMGPTFAHVIFEPADNLGKYGWDLFNGPEKTAAALSWPLHALGDATVPMHVVNTSGWGHRPFEDAVENNWAQLIFLTAVASEQAQAESLQRQQAARILALAYKWRKLILDWRAVHPTPGNDVPIRDLITALATDTFHYAQSQAPSGWPYDPAVSSEYAAEDFVDKSSIASSHYESEDAIHRARPLIENGTAAILAFLMSAAER